VVNAAEDGPPPGEVSSEQAPAPDLLAAERGRVLIEESRDMIVILDGEDRVVATSRRARAAFPGLWPGLPAPPGLLDPGAAHFRVVPYEVGGRRERIVHLGSPAELAAYEELRVGFTAAVSHELRTPLARLLSLLEMALLPGAQPEELLEQARREVEETDELIREVLFLSELETGREVVSLGSTRALPTVAEVLQRMGDRAERANVRLLASVDPDVAVPLRQRMLRVIVENLAENAIRYSGEGSTFTLSVGAESDRRIVLEGVDDGVGVPPGDLPRLFERFYRADRARLSRGTGLGLAIVKHVVVAAGGAVEASGAPGEGLRIRCSFPSGSTPPWAVPPGQG
jgi:two-component system, OmpR family, phosphate regulon sensor histidine kinase PhoR